MSALLVTYLIEFALKRSLLYKLTYLFNSGHTTWEKTFEVYEWRFQLIILIT
jgi:hypothetical protein